MLLAGAAGASLSSCGNKTGAAIDLTVDTRGQEIQFWTGFGTTITSALETVLEEFTEETGIKVTHTGQGGYDNLQAAINGSASSITYPNVAVGYPDHFAGYIDSDIQERLDDFIAQDKNIPETREALEGYPVGNDGKFHELPAFNIDDFDPAYMVENRSLEYDESGNPYTMGIPFNKSTEVMVYNRSFFELEGVKAAGIALPTTWAEASTQSQKILSYLNTNKVLPSKDATGKKTVAGQILASDGKVYASASAMEAAAKEAKTTYFPVLDATKLTVGEFRPMSYDSQANFFITGVRQWGGTYSHVDKTTRRGYIDFQKGTATREFLTAVNDLYQEGGIGIPQTWGEAAYCSTPFKNYKSLMNIGSSAGVTNSIGSTVKFTVDCAPIPYHREDKKYVISQGTNLAIFDIGTTAQKAASWKLVKYLSQIKNGLFAALTGYYPTCGTALNSEDYQDFINHPVSDNDKINAAAAKVNTDIYSTADTTWEKFVDPGFNGSSAIRTDIGTITAEIFIDNAGVASTIEKHVNSLSSYVEGNN